MRREDELGRKHGSGDPEKKREKDASKSATLKDSRKEREDPPDANVARSLESDVDDGLVR